MTKTDNSYKSLLKGTSIFGGVQVFQMLISLVRGKFVAMLLGPEGMGINSLLVSSITPLQQVSSLGLSLSIVKEIAGVANGDMTLRQRVVSICRKALLITGLFGTILTIVLSPWLSKWTFGSGSYTWAFMALSIYIFLMTLSNGELSILQGSHKVKVIAKSSLIGSTLGLVTGIPLYYYFGLNGIVPSLIILALDSYITYRLFAKKEQIKGDNAKLKDNLPLLRKMIGLGVTLMVASIIGSLTIYLINIFIRTNGVVSDVGLYSAANSISTQYVGVIFTAMAMDYFPRLTAAGDDIISVNRIVNRQIELVVLLICPLCCGLIIFAPIVVKLLLASDFSGTIPLLKWMGVSLFFKAWCFPMGYISFSKGDKKTFFILEGVWSNIFNLGMSCFCYYRFGLVGLAYAQVVIYTFSVAIYMLVDRIRYGYSMNRAVIRLSLILTIPILTLLYISEKNEFFLTLWIGIPITIIVSILSFLSLKKKYNTAD